MPNPSSKPGARLDVYSIHYNLDAPYPIYLVGRNNDFDFEYIAYAEEDLWKENPIATELPEPPDNLWISIKRIAANRFENAT